MITWRSFTTSKVLPTFVGEQESVSSLLVTFTREKATAVVQNVLGGERTQVTRGTYIQTPQNSYYVTRFEETSNAYAWNGIGPFPGAPSNFTLNFIREQKSLGTTSVTVNQNSTFRSTYGRTEDAGPTPFTTQFFSSTILISPSQKVRQETSTTSEYQSNYRTTTDRTRQTTFWTTSVSNSKTTFVTDSAETIEIAAGNATRIGASTYTTTIEEVEFKTYTATDGDVVVVANTIAEQNSNILFASAFAPDSKMPVSEFSFAPTRFTLSHQESYTETIENLVDKSDRTFLTTESFVFTETESTAANQTLKETWAVWGVDEESRVGCDPERTLWRTKAASEIYSHFDSTEIPITRNTTESTAYFQNTTPTTISIVVGGGGAGIPFTQRVHVFGGPVANYPISFTSTQSYTTETTTFSVSGDLLTSSTVNHPGYIDIENFPIRSFGDGAKRLFYKPNPQTSLIQTTTAFATTATTQNEVNQFESFRNFFDENFERTAAALTQLTIREIKTGEFFAKLRSSSFLTTLTNSAEVLKANLLTLGFADPKQALSSQNSVTSAGALVTAAAQHTWTPEKATNSRGRILPGVVGAVPLTPTFRGVVSENSEGWPLCEKSEYTTISGSRIGRSFTTTASWRDSDGLTSDSGSFEIDTAASFEYGVARDGQRILGGFMGPNPAHTVVISPGVALVTTFDSATSGTASTNYETGTTAALSPQGPVQVTISSFIPRVQGHGLYTQRLVDNGLP